MIQASTLDMIAAAAQDLAAGARCVKLGLEQNAFNGARMELVMPQLILHMKRNKDLLDSIMAHFDLCMSDGMPEWMCCQLSQAPIAADLGKEEHKC